MAGRVLTNEDFKEGKDPQDTSKTPEPDEIIEGDKIVKAVGDKVIVQSVEKEEPEEKVEPSESKKEPTQPSDFKPKHKTWEETERARLEAERKMHETTTRLSQTERELTQLREPPKKAVTVDDRIKDITKTTMNQIRLVPAEDPDRDDKVGYLWAKNASDIEDIKYEERERTKSSQQSVVSRTYKKATEEGLKSDAELRILGHEFSKTDPSLSVDDRISEAIGNTKNILSQVREGFVEKQERDKKEKEDLKVLGRGSSRQERSEKKEEEGSETMAQAMVNLKKQRTMKKEDLVRY